MEHGRLQGVQPAVDAHRFVQIPHTASVDTQHRQRIGQPVVIGRH